VLYLHTCNTVRWAWLDWGLSGWLTILLQCFWNCWFWVIIQPYNLYCVGADVKPCPINDNSNFNFYFAMHCARCTVLRSHVLCLSVCLSVRLSVTLVDCDHIGYNSSEIIWILVSRACSLSAEPNIRGLFQGEHPEILAQSDPPPVDVSVGDIRSQIAAEWLQI